MERNDEESGTAAASLSRAKLSYSVHLVPADALGTAVRSRPAAPKAGDIVLARVESVGQVSRLELPGGRRATLFPGDEIVAVYGSCCAPDQYEAEVPSDLGPCDLVTSGGVAGHTLSTHAKVGAPTRLVPMSLLADTEGRPLNLADWRLPRVNPPAGASRPTTLLVLGTASRAGTAAAGGALVQGFVRRGQRVGAAKVTGTGGAGMWLLADGGATPVLDVTHAGRPSTHRIGPDGLSDVFQTLSGHLAEAGVDVIVLVMAETAFDPETTDLLAGAVGAGGVDGVIFTAADALSAVAGVSRVEELGLSTVAVAGTLTASPLAAREARTSLPHVPVLTRDELAHPLVAEKLGGFDSRIGRPA